MFPHHIEGFLSTDFVSRIRRILARDQIRHEDEAAVLDGLKGSLAHRLARNAELRLAHMHGDDCHDPIPMRAKCGTTLIFISRRVRCALGDRAELVYVRRADSCATCRAALARWGAPSLPEKLWRPGSLPHIADDHPERLGVLTPTQVRSRLSSALREARDYVESNPSLVSAYWYPGTKEWAWVVPIRLIAGGPPLAGVLNERQHRLELVTLLPLREAFWNIASLGQTPPAWLNGEPPIHGAA